MGWDTRLYTGVIFNRKTYKSKALAQEDLDGVKKSIEYYKRKLHQFAVMTEPKKFCEEDEDPQSWIGYNVEEFLDALQELYVEEYKLNLLIENFDEAYDKEKKAFKKLPEGFEYDSAFIEGDFIE